MMFNFIFIFQSGHVPSITVGFEALGTNYLLDLELNR